MRIWPRAVDESRSSFRCNHFRNVSKDIQFASGFNLGFSRDGIYLECCIFYVLYPPVGGDFSFQATSANRNCSEITEPGSSRAEQVRVTIVQIEIHVGLGNLLLEVVRDSALGWV